MSLSKLARQWLRLTGLAEDASGEPVGVRLVAWHVRATDSEWVSRVWALAQSEAGLPAPVISVDGASGWQLWFALAQPRPQEEVERVLRHLITGLLGEPGVGDAQPAPLSFTCWLGVAEGALDPAEAGVGAVWPPVPRQVAPERWSAFVAPDLVPVFAESPWLDCAPGEEGQAALLSRLVPIGAADWARLAKAASAEARPAGGSAALASGDLASGEAAQPAASGDPRAFLLSVMNDPSVEMALRIEAARVLLAHG